MDLGIHDAHHASPSSSTVGFSPSDRSIAIESILCGLVPHLTQASITCYDIRTHDQEGATMAKDWPRREVLTTLSMTAAAVMDSVVSTSRRVQSFAIVAPS